jgi:hypothetical protein
MINFMDSFLWVDKSKMKLQICHEIVLLLDMDFIFRILCLNITNEQVDVTSTNMNL